MQLEPLEQSVLQKLLTGNHSILTSLRNQLRNLSVVSRAFTGTGFFTEFLVDDLSISSEQIPLTASFGDVEASIAGLENGAGFLLYTVKGKIQMLEGYSYEEPWPELILQFSLSYHDNDRTQFLKKLS